MHKKILPKSILSGGPSKASLTPTFRDDKSTFESECDNWQRASFEKSTGPLLPKPQNQTRGLESLFLTSFLGHRENEAEFAYQRDESTEPSERASWASIIKGVLGNHFLVVCVCCLARKNVLGPSKNGRFLCDHHLWSFFFFATYLGGARLYRGTRFIWP